ncbi:hypothetical protein [Marinoscillum sp. MHG1-6]|uniref:hypothetical protein n=1 Tax=Marinoscillum sp. MHG1-6 TaxID=2959627 RepID=UPI0021589862|nr:hypothetical protein [Marinoscillum sp. MHG1-6]
MKILDNFFNLFKPSYSVVVSMYHVVPGRKVQKYDHRHDFGKGGVEQARTFYNAVIAKHTETGFPGTEINLIKGKGTVVHTKQFGPVDMIKTLNVA